MLHHVTREEAISAAINPISNPNRSSLDFVRDERGVNTDKKRSNGKVGITLERSFQTN
jgi:hypothetical protein